jgi:hypothetical protein
VIKAYASCTHYRPGSCRRSETAPSGAASWSRGIGAFVRRPVGLRRPTGVLPVLRHRRHGLSMCACCEPFARLPRNGLPAFTGRLDGMEIRREHEGRCRFPPSRSGACRGRPS